jgi:hypothetical protein
MTDALVTLAKAGVHASNPSRIPSSEAMTNGGFARMTDWEDDQGWSMKRIDGFILPA